MHVFVRVFLYLIALPLYFFYTLETRVRDRIAISLNDKHLDKRIVSLDPDLASGKKFAIFAIFPRLEMLNSVKRLRTFIVKEGFTPIFIVNDNPLASKWISAMEKFGDTIILRRNIGHDFGAYQSGITFLESKGLLLTTDQLLLVNDSAIYTPRSQALLDSFFETVKPWKSLTFSTQPEFHSQSYFLAFGPEILKSEVFRQFWRDYYPTSLRHLVIKHGEIGLSRILIDAGWLPVTLDSKQSATLINPAKHPLKLEERIALFSDSTGYTGVGEIDSELVENRLFHELYERNPSQTLGPYLARTAGYPLKRDLLYGRLYSHRDIVRCLEECGIEGQELEELRELFLSTLVVRSGTLHSLWRRFGFAR
ncbi:MAG: rhamnan synthesis F family protein [Actinomycetota bacterium]